MENQESHEIEVWVMKSHGKSWKNNILSENKKAKKKKKKK